ncbi:MAG: helicase HerA domain-containing protein, partial [Candidatus Thorarchaeota archaeon]
MFSSSVILFIVSYIKVKSPIIEFIQPSIRESRRGEIKIGKIKKSFSFNYNFRLSIEDLEKHMFICGSTGTGKSNFLQYFLINFVKKFEIPFLLVEFKGEYHFLQQKIENMLILWPGENFSINIFDPLGTDPEIHAERIFDILKSGQFLEDNAEYSPQMEKVLIEI